MSTHDAPLHSRQVERGQYLFRQGEQDWAAYIVKDGLIETWHHDSSDGGAGTKVGHYGQGTILGEMALVSDEVRPVSARAATASHVLIVTREEFRKRLDSADPVIAAICRLLGHRLADMPTARHGDTEESGPNGPDRADSDGGITPRRFYVKPGQRAEFFCTLADLVPGMRLSRSYRTAKGTKVAAAGQVLTPRMIRRLREMEAAGNADSAAAVYSNSVPAKRSDAEPPGEAATTQPA